MRVSRGVWWIALAALAVPAVAQDNGSEEPKVSRKLYIGPQVGVYLPTDRLARQRFGDQWTNVGLGLGPIVAPSDQGETTYDLTFISSRTRIQGTNNRVFQQSILVVPVNILYRKGFGAAEGNGVRGYWGGSVGAIVTQMESQFDDIKSGWRSGWGGSAFVGVVLSKQAYAEARYFQSTKIKAFDLSGLNLSVGVRF